MLCIIIALWEVCVKWNGEHEKKKKKRKLIMDFCMRLLRASHFSKLWQTTVAGHWAHGTQFRGNSKVFAVFMRSFNNIYKHNPAECGGGVCSTKQQPPIVHSYCMKKNERILLAASDSSTKLLYKWHRLNGFAKLTASKEFPVIISRFRFFFLFFFLLHFARQW